MLVRRLLDFLKSEFRNKWKEELFADNNNSKGGNKLRTYRLFKTQFYREEYLTDNNNFHRRKKYACLRLSCHRLAIETGRFTNKELEDRICTKCKSKEVEDETHLLLKCEMYKDDRKLLFNVIKKFYSNFDVLKAEEKFMIIMSSLNDEIRKASVNYVYHCM